MMGHSHGHASSVQDENGTASPPVICLCLFVFGPVSGWSSFSPFRADWPARRYHHASQHSENTRPDSSSLSSGLCHDPSET
jgi:hypothetical protein